jgi:hypothetical protein
MRRRWRGLRKYKGSLRRARRGLRHRWRGLRKKKSLRRARRYLRRRWRGLRAWGGSCLRRARR